MADSFVTWVCHYESKKEAGTLFGPSCFFLLMLARDILTTNIPMWPTSIKYNEMEHLDVFQSLLSMII